MPRETAPRVLIFNKEQPSSRPFHDWVKTHNKNKPRGYVINTNQPNPNKNYAKLHDTACGRLDSKRGGPNGATHSKYQKFCSESLFDLVAYLEKHNIAPSDISPCGLCLRHAPTVQALMSESLDEIIITTKEKLNIEGNRKLVMNLAAERDPDNRRRVLKNRAQPYRCDACDETLAGYGPDYSALIHVHHIKPLALKPNRPSLKDFLLLCPNCHAVAHWGRVLKPLSRNKLKKRAAAMRAARTGYKQ